MPTILISLISDQTVPNLLLIKELEGSYESMVFISTPNMEKYGKSGWIEVAAGIEQGTVPRIVVEENNWCDITDKLASYNWPFDSKFIVNQTGGTKVMTLAVFDFFAKLESTIVYVPIGKNQYEELYPRHDIKGVEINYRLNLNDYFLVHGLHFEAVNDFIFHPSKTKQFFSTFQSRNFSFRQMPEIINSHQFETEKERCYYGGVWFEEFVYHLLLQKLHLQPHQIGMNVKLFRNPGETHHDNEYDVVFTKDNSLYIIECKASSGSCYTIKDKMNNYLYKLGAVTRDFGLRVNSFIFTLTDVKQIAKQKSDGIERRRKILGIKAILDAVDFKELNRVINHLSK